MRIKKVKIIVFIVMIDDSVFKVGPAFCMFWD